MSIESIDLPGPICQQIQETTPVIEATSTTNEQERDAMLKVAGYSAALFFVGATVTSTATYYAYNSFRKLWSSDETDSVISAAIHTITMCCGGWIATRAAAITFSAGTLLSKLADNYLETILDDAQLEKFNIEIPHK